MIEEEEEKKKREKPWLRGFTQSVDEDFDCDYSPISSLFDGAGLYYEEPFTEDKYYHRTLRPRRMHPRERYLRLAPIYRYEGWYEG